jgi:hypothetical protein
MPDLKRSLVALLLFTALASSTLTGCKDVGFKQLPEPGAGGSRDEAWDLIQQVRQGLTAYKERNGEYPTISEQFLYDSIRNMLDRTIDPEYLYRNDKGKGYYLGVGGRSNRLVYHFPGTIGPADYTLYWVGPNGVDEAGEGDDIPAWTPADTTVPVKFERKRITDMIGDGSRFQLRLISSGNDLYNDSVTFTINEYDTVLYRDKWPLFAYFDYRPELREAERTKIVRTELGKFFDASQFVMTDSIFEHNWKPWVTIDPKTTEGQEITKMNGLLFNYYAGSRGSKGIVWSPIKKKFVDFWRSDHKAQALMAIPRKKK